MEFTIRQAVTEDAHLINKLASKVWNHTYGSIHTQEQLDYMFEQMYNPQHLSLLIREQQQHFYIGYEGHTPIGYFSIEQKEEALFYLHKLYILPEYQGTGAGKFMFCSAISVIKKLHPEPFTLELNVNRQNKAIRFYEHMGMEKFKESDDHIGEGFVMNNCFMRMTIK